LRTIVAVSANHDAGYIHFFAVSANHGGTAVSTNHGALICIWNWNSAHHFSSLSNFITKLQKELQEPNPFFNLLLA
jgi:hypothetical protein